VSILLPGEAAASPVQRSRKVKSEIYRCNQQAPRPDDSQLQASAAIIEEQAETTALCVHLGSRLRHNIIYLRKARSSSE
jgi:hypothetical protein